MQPFHAGELSVQQRAGVRSIAERTGRIIDSEVPEAGQVFLSEAPFLVVGGSAGDPASGGVWASVITGSPGFIEPGEDGFGLDERLRHALPDGDPWLEVRAGSAVGTVAVDPATRRRMRLNGRKVGSGSGVGVQATQVYANCPKFISVRHLIGIQEPSAARVAVGQNLTAETEEFISGRDTFFIATATREEGADCSHRGGAPGFVRVAGDVLSWGDYAGNAMFNTLGNLELDKRCGLLFWDFASGSYLQLSGTGTTRWQGAERSVEFRVREWRLVVEGTPLRYDR